MLKVDYPGYQDVFMSELRRSVLWYRPSSCTGRQTALDPASRMAKK